MIELCHITRKYGSVTALKDVSFRVEKGQIAGLLGRNGAGKTTALNVLTGYLPPTAGDVLLDGQNLAEHPRECKRRMGYLPERPPLYDEMTVTEYLLFVCELREVAPGARKKHTDEIVELCGLQEYRNRLLGHLSKGYRQRAGIAQALCGSPDALILDEPTAGLDPKQTAETRELIRRLGKERTILFSSHILSEVQQICTHAIILKEGEIARAMALNAADGDELRLSVKVAGNSGAAMEALKALACVKSAAGKGRAGGVEEIGIVCRRDDRNGNPAEQVFRALAAARAAVRELREEQDSLEEIFLRET